MKYDINKLFMMYYHINDISYLSYFYVIFEVCTTIDKLCLCTEI